MKMKKDEMPFRLREFLPVFGPERHCKHWERVEDLAEFLGKQPRTVEAYLSYREDRTISPDDYWKVAVEWVKRRAGSEVEAAFIVLDDNCDQLFECRWLWQAQFLADVEGFVIHAKPQSLWQLRRADEKAALRSRLRRLVREGIVSKNQICQVFNFDQHCLVDYQLEGVSWLSTPDELRLSMLEAYVREQIGEAA